MKLATIIVPSHNRTDHLKNLLDILDKSIFDINVCLGGSFAENCNRGARATHTDKIIFLNDDTLPTNEDLKKICEALDHFDMVGASQITGNNLKCYGIGLEQRNDGIRFNIRQHHSKSLFPSAFCLGIKKQDWKNIGGFDERFRTGNEDVDLGIRAIEQGFKMTILDLEIKHLESQSEGRFKYMNDNEELLYEMYDQDYLIKLDETKKI